MPVGRSTCAPVLDVPILTEPMNIFKLLMGDKAVTLITLDLPALGMEFSYSQYFPIVGPLGARIGGKVGFKADLAFGFDTRGFFDAAESGNIGDVFNGLYVSDRANADGTGADVVEATLYGELTASGELNLGIARGGVGGGLYFGLDMNLNDPDGDGKVRVNELVSNFLLRPDCIFDMTGKLEAFLNAYVEIGFSPFSVSMEWEFARITILDFTIPRPDPSESAVPLGLSALARWCTSVMATSYWG